MNKYLKELVENGESKIPNLDKKELNIYRTGVLLLASSVCEDFLDIPVLDVDGRFNSEGLFYTIEHLHSDTLYTSNNLRTLLVVWEIENRISYCPLRIGFELTDEDNFGIIVYDQTGEITKKAYLFQREEGKYYSEIKGYDKLTLSELVKQGL